MGIREGGEEQGAAGEMEERIGGRRETRRDGAKDGATD